MAKHPVKQTRTSFHADLRARKRFKLSDPSAEFDEALVHGVPIQSFKGVFGRYLTNSAIKHRSNGIVYKSKIFWFMDESSGIRTLKTVYPVERKFHKYLKKKDEAMTNER